MVSISWYLGCLKGYLGGAGICHGHTILCTYDCRTYTIDYIPSSIDSKRLEHDRPPTPNKETRQTQHKSSYIHVPHFWYYIDYMLWKSSLDYIACTIYYTLHTMKPYTIYCSMYYGLYIIYYILRVIWHIPHIVDHIPSTIDYTVYHIPSRLQHY